MSFKTNSNMVTLVTIIIFLAISSIDIGRPPVDLHQFRQTQTLSTIYNYYIGGINIFKPEIDTNGSYSNVILELPIYQAASAFLMKIFGYYEFIPRLINLVVVIFTGLFLAKIADEFVKKAAFAYVLALFFFNPSTLFWSAVPLIDHVPVLLSVVSAYYFFRWLERPGIVALIFSIACGALAVATKIPSTFIAFFSLFFLCLFRWVDKRSITSREIFGVIAFFGFISIAFLGWQFYSSQINQINPHGYTSAGLVWYLGTNSQRLSLEVWAHFYNRLMGNHLFYVPLFFFCISIIVYRFDFRSKLLMVPAVLLSAIVFYFIIFVNLNFVHTYYQIPINSAMAIVGGVALASIHAKVSKYKILDSNLICLALIVLLAGFSKNVLNNSWIDLANISSPYEVSACEFEIGRQIKSYLEARDINTNLIGVVKQQNDKCWNGPHAIMYYMKRRGYVTSDINDPILNKEPLDLIIKIYRDDDLRHRDGWQPFFSNALDHTVSDWRFAIFQKGDLDQITVKTIDLELPAIKGDASHHFNTKFRYADANIPPFSIVKIEFVAKSIDPKNSGYFLLRTYSGGYKYDQFRYLRFESPNQEKRFSFIMKTDRYDDYVLEFGQIKEGGFIVTSPILLSTESRLR